MKTLKSIASFIACTAILIAIGYFGTIATLKYADEIQLEAVIDIYVCIECVLIFLGISEKKYHDATCILSWASVVMHITCTLMFIHGVYDDILPTDDVIDHFFLIKRIAFVWVLRFLMQIYVLSNKKED